METNQFKMPIIIKVLVVGALVAISPKSFAAQIKSAPQKKKMTVGDMLKKVQDDSRGGKASLLQNKGATALPESEFAFKSRQAINLSSVKPPKSSELFKYDNSDQSAYEKTLDTQIKELYKLTQKFKTSNNRGELWLRLAELYVEKSSLVDARKQDEYDKQLKTFEAGKTKTKPKLDVAEAREYNRKAIQLYEWFARDYPTDPKLSQALFFLGYNYFELSDSKKGSLYYTQLTRQFPTSPFIGEAHFALGEYYFESEKWADAYKEYSKLMKDTKHRLNSFSFYKAAWCLFRLGKTEQSIQYMDYIVKSGKTQQAAQSVSGKKLNSSRLENEALRDLVVFFADLGDTKRAIDYFSKVSSKEGRTYIERLGYYFADKGNRDASKDIFRMLIDQEPTSKKAFEYQYQIVQNYFYSKNSPQFKEELYRWITDFGPNSAWYAAHQEDKPLLLNSVKLREQTLRNYILQQHQTAQNSRAVYSRTAASEGYKLYFQEFPLVPQAAEMHFFYGELLYDMGKYDDAATQYSWLTENALNSKFASKASQNLLLSIEKALPKDEELQKRVGDSIDPIQMDPRVERFIKSATWYTQKFPTSDKDAEIKFRMGRLYYQTNNFGPAEVLFKEIVRIHSKTKYSEYSANLLLDMYNLKKDYVGLEKMGTELLANASIASSKAGSDIRDVLEKASFKKAQDFEIEKKYYESAVQYQLFANQNSKSELAVIALFNAGVNFERSGRNGDAIQNYKKVINSADKKSEPLRPKAQKLLAKLYQDSGNFAESAKLYKELAAANPKDPLAPNYLYNTALMYEVLGKTNEAVNLYLAFIKGNKNQTENANTLFNLAQLQRKAGQTLPAINHYKDFVELPQARGEKKIEANYWIYEIGRKRGRRTESQEAAENVVALQRRAGNDKKANGASFTAKILFERSLATFAQLKSIAIPAAPERQKKAVDAKLDVLANLTSELSKIIKLDSAEEIVNSLNLIGESNDHMTKAILNTPLPTKLSEDQKKQYRESLEQITDKFTKKASESYKVAIDRARDLDVYNDAYRNALNEMSRREPGLYYNKGEVSVDTRLVNWMGDK